MCSVTASHAKHAGFDSCCPHNRREWWHSPVALLLGDRDMGWLEKSVVPVLVTWIHTDVWLQVGALLNSWECGTAMTLTVHLSLHRNHGHPCSVCLISKNKQLMDSQIGVNSIPSPFNMPPPVQTVSCLLQYTLETYSTSYKCWA